MPLNSITFLCFFAAVVVAFYALPGRLRLPFLLGASGLFYLWGRPAQLLCLVFLTAVCRFCGPRVARSASPTRRAWLALGLGLGVGQLVILKYSNFLLGSLDGILATAGVPALTLHLDVLAPLGISFFTLQSMGYLIDLHRGRREPEPSLLRLGLFVSFFPLLLSGPIERSTRLLPQFDRPPEPDYDRVTDGLRQMLFGFFKKLVVADRAGVIVDQVWAAPGDASGPALAAAAVLYTFQIYYDFAGYSDIAIGAARALGFNVMPNFDRPYRSASVAEFWRRWHISLSSWFRDYLYIPLGGNRVARPRLYLNLLLVFLVSGLWHGAGLTFIVWGLLHGSYLIAGNYTRGLRDRAAAGLGLARTPGLARALAVGSTFALVAYAWIYFRAPTISDAFTVTAGLFSGWAGPTALLGQWRALPVDFRYDAFLAVVFILAMEVIESLRGRHDLAGRFSGLPTAARWAFYYGVLFLIFNFGQFGQFGRRAFIYFQF